LNDIHTLADLARVKKVVVNNIKKDGWAVLNANDEECRKIGDSLNCNVAWFSLNENSTFVKN
jgi:cyanophycin synthetase